MEKFYQKYADKFSIPRPPPRPTAPEVKTKGKEAKGGKEATARGKDAKPQTAPKKRKMQPAVEPPQGPPKKKRKPRQNSPTPITTAPR
eukprot:scaffold649550_cov41-Prasinocladus_malaysianus.AAC.1